MLGINSSFSSLSLVLILLLAVLIAVGVTAFFAFQFRERRVKDIFDALMGSLDESKRRLSIIERHAKEYINHIDPAVRGDLQVAKRLIGCTEQLLANAECMLTEGGISNIVEVEEMLDTPLSEFHNPLQSLVTVNDELPGIYPYQLDQTVDIIFQRVGEEVAKASTEAKRLGFKPRNRGSTVNSLIDAGIRYVNRQRRRISSGSFINPNEEAHKKH